MDSDSSDSDWTDSNEDQSDNKDNILHPPPPLSNTSSVMPNDSFQCLTTSLQTKSDLSSILPLTLLVGREGFTFTNSIQWHAL